MTVLCIWISQQVASDSITRLCSHLCANTAILMISEGLNQRFNRCAVLFLQRVFRRYTTKAIHLSKRTLFHV
ncbi:hypothetical protein BEU27_27950 [Bacillus anthracis]|nr:hypothetical protein BZG08_30130 [Bacillus anthracis]OON42763.1 hypothetical protein B0R37_30755 [Bacillus anthracis]OOX79929.1 hypothetical protein BEU30_27845 [Bacillus anthracis]OPE62963.1 hypothetical protein BEU29_27595 [Bacillus anthracis]OPE63609.1 hypothetical protein BEU28_27390 [Bacillus anthracis]